MSGVAFGMDEDAGVHELLCGAFDGFAVMGKTACSFDPFVEVAKVDNFGASFSPFVEKPLPKFSGGGGEAVLYAECCVFFRPNGHSCN